MFTSSLSTDLNVFPLFFYFIIQFIRCKPYSFFITNLSKIKIFFQIKKSVNKIQLTHISIIEWNFFVIKSASLNILIIVVVRWFPSNKSSNFLLDFTYNLLILLKKKKIWWFSSRALSQNSRNSTQVRTMLSMSLLPSLLWWLPSCQLAIKPEHVKALIPTNVAYVKALIPTDVAYVKVLIPADVVEAWRKNTQCSLDGTETKLLVSGRKPQIHKGFLEST